MRRDDLIGGLVWFFLGAALCIGSVKLRLGSLERPGPGFIAFLSGAVLGGLGLVLIFSFISKRLREREEIRGEKIWGEERWRTFFITLSALFVCVVLFEYLGFLLSTFLFLFCLFKLREPKRWLIPIVLSITTVILSYFVFSVWLRSPFPTGILRF